jgi:hypothetical protein
MAVAHQHAYRPVIQSFELWAELGLPLSSRFLKA